MCTCTTSFSMSPGMDCAYCARRQTLAVPHHQVPRTLNQPARTWITSLSTSPNAACRARSMPIFMVAADEGQVPHAPWKRNMVTWGEQVRTEIAMLRV